MLNTEQERSENLLLNILPGDIAARLKSGSGVIADQFSEASILFADVVNFTPLSARLSADQLVHILNEIFSEFDNLAEKYGLEKIKTIGDCYMVVAGVPHVRFDHAEAVVNTASRMESHGVAGRVQITKNTRDKLGEKFVCESAGVIAVKGKAEMEVFLVADQAAQRGG